MKIGYGTYGMPNLPVLDAIAATAAIGYAGIELAAMPNWPAAPDALDAPARAAAHSALLTRNLELSGLMTALDVMSDDARFAEQTAYLREAARLGHDLDETKPPILIATIGGGAGQWEPHRDQIASRIATWCEACGQENAIFALEPHVGGAIHTPYQAEELREAVNSPVLKYNFDMSHFILHGLPTAECAALMAPHSVHTHVKDAAGDAQHVSFLLPGDGDFDYPEYLREMRKFGYDGFITVEVSGMVWNAEGYDPIASAQRAFDCLASAFVAAGI